MRASHLALALLTLPLLACTTTPDYGRPLPEGAPALLRVREDERPDFTLAWYDREELFPALRHSIEWTEGAHARRFFPVAGITHGRALASLKRFEEILEGSRSAQEFEQALDREFDVYVSAGWDGKGGGVLFTGYYTPIFDGRLVRGGEYQHPLYALPPDLAKGRDGEILGRRTAAGGLEPYPTRRAIEAGALARQDLELIWLRSALDAYVAHVNGSAFVRIADGTIKKFGYAGKNGRPYSSLGRALVADGVMTEDEVSLPAIRRWGQTHPDQVEAYLNRNESYVFFTEIDGNPRGSLNVEVTPGRTIATDKSLFPRGALVWVDTRLPEAGGRERLFERFMLDQDTGGAIRTAGRADLYLGVGPEAEAVAGRTRSPGQMYYLFLRQPGAGLPPR